MKTFKEFIGEYVVIKFEQDFIDDYCDPYDPDTWVAVGFLCSNSTGYNLIYHPSQPEYQYQGAIAFGEFQEDDVNTISDTNNNFYISDLHQHSLDFMKRDNYVFTNSASTSWGNISTGAFIPSSVSVSNPCCNDCRNSNIFSMVCKLKGHHIGDMKKETCSNFDRI